MSSSPSETKPPDDYDHFLVLHGATWSDYERVLELRGERSVPRISYLEGLLQFITPSIEHEMTKSVITRLIEAWCVEYEVGLRASGSWTLQKKDAQCGLEPDGGYVFDRTGDIRDPEYPELALEVILTPGGVAKLDIYRKLGVPEVWIWRGTRFTIHQLTADKDTYIEEDKSKTIPELDLTLLERFVSIRPLNQALREFRAAIAPVT